MSVANRLDWDICVPAGSVNVRVEAGWVWLSGVVEWRYQRYAAEQDVRPVTDVSGVCNLIAVRARPTADAVQSAATLALNLAWRDAAEPRPS